MEVLVRTGCRGGGGGSGGGGFGGGSQTEMELGPSQGEGLLGAGEVEEPPSSLLSRKTAIMSQFESKALGLDKAILHSIDCCGEERQRKQQMGLGQEKNTRLHDE